MERHLFLAALELVTAIALVVLIYQVRRMWLERGLSDEQIRGLKPPLRMETIAHYSHEPETIWALIRPAEAAVLLGHWQRAFHVPGTPVGVGEQ